jgi:hypothetical protein
MMLNLTRSGPTWTERRLEAENRRLREHLAVLTDRLSELQRANEGAYAADYDKSGGPRLDIEQPFGSLPSRKLGTLWLKGGAK